MSDEVPVGEGLEGDKGRLPGDEDIRDDVAQLN